MFYTSTFNEVEALVRRYGTRDPFELISAVPDMKLWVTDNFQEDGLKGFATIQNRTKYIVVNGLLIPEEQLVVPIHLWSYHISSRRPVCGCIWTTVHESTISI